MLLLDIGPHGKWFGYAAFALIGFAFGAVLELAGFGNSRKLAAQFYLKDMTVLKVMFTGILTACLLLFVSSSLGWLDFSKIFVNQTYLWPGIVGGLIMGVGFVVGGYCPGTSIVSAASLKVDGMTFFAGTAIGAGLFGESVGAFERFWNGSYTERLLLSDWLGWSVGATVVGVTVLALAFFYGAEKVEAAMASEPLRLVPRSPRKLAAAGAAMAIALTIWGIGEPTPEQKWQRAGAQYQPMLDQRAVFIHPLEWVKTWNDAAVKLVTLDLRDEAGFEAFHLAGARRVTFDGLLAPELSFSLNQLPPNGVVVLVADDEDGAVRAWKRLKVQGVTNLYVLDQGLSRWKETFAPLGATTRFDLAKPPARVLDAFPKDAFVPRIKLKTSRRAAGLCS